MESSLTEDSLIAGGKDGSIQIFEFTEGGSLRKVNEIKAHVNEVTSLHLFKGPFYKDLMATGSKWDNVKLWDFRSGQLIGSLKCQSTVYKILYSERDQLVICGENGVYVIEGVIGHDRLVYKSKFNITSSNIKFVPSMPSKFIAGCDENQLVIRDISHFQNENEAHATVKLPGKIL